MKQSDGNLYEGEWNIESKEKNGKGIMVYENGKAAFKGDWKAN